MTHFSDRSRYETGQRCARSRYWGYHHEGRGVEPLTNTIDQLFGLAVHWEIEAATTLNHDGRAVNDDLYKLMDLVADETTPDGQPVAYEYRTLFQGLTDTFKRYTLPSLLDEYEWLDSEVEITLPLPGVRWGSRLDGVLRRRADGLYFVAEVKTSSYMDDLIAGALTNFQLLMEIEAMRAHYKLEPEQLGGAILIVLNKGRRQRASDSEQKRGVDGHRRLSPFTYAYRKDYADGRTSYSPEYKAGWDRTPAWTIPGWLDLLNNEWPELVKQQVLVVPSVSFDSERCQSVQHQVRSQEEIYSDYQTYVSSSLQAGDIDSFFPQNFTQCHNYGGFRRKCAWFDCCHSPQVGLDPVGSGDFRWRTPNHPQENEK